MSSNNKTNEKESLWFSRKLFYDMIVPLCANFNIKALKKTKISKNSQRDFVMLELWMVALVIALLN
jgi:hypothetical protein